MAIIVCGLGPAGTELITAETAEFLNTGLPVWARTEHHPACETLNLDGTFDSFYNEAESYEAAYEAIAEKLLGLGESQDIIYATPGSPYVLEDVVRLLQSQDQVKVRILPAMSFLDLCWDRLRVDPVTENVQVVDAQTYVPDTRAAHPVLITQVYSIDLASKVKLSFDDDFEVMVLTDLGSNDEKVDTISIFDLDRIEPTNRTSVYIPKQGKASNADLQAAVDLISTLRKECPWDAKQTHQTLIPYLKEEATEVIEAIEALDDSVAGDAHFEEELGDLLLQVLLHSEIASESARFTIYDVAATLTEKMIRRHPHVFGDSKAETLEELESQWQEIKQEERDNNPS